MGPVPLKRQRKRERHKEEREKETTPPILSISFSELVNSDGDSRSITEQI